MGFPLHEKVERTLSAIDEITLALFFSDLGFTWTNIDIVYNVSAYHLYPIFGNRTKVLHFITAHKPWSVHADGTSERDYVKRAAGDPTRHHGYQSHTKCVEMWWEVYGSRTG